jgi:hypothetical protein
MFKEKLCPVESVGFQITRFIHPLKVLEKPGEKNHFVPLENPEKKLFFISFPVNNV